MSTDTARPAVQPPPQSGASTLGFGLWAAVLVGVAATGLRELIVTGPWFTQLESLIGAMSLIGTGLQYALRRAPAPVRTTSVAGVVALLMAGATVHAAAGDVMVRGLWPTRAALRQTGKVLGDAMTALSYEVPPTRDVATFVPLAFAGLGLVIALVVTAAVVWRSAAVMVLGALLPWAFVLTMRWDSGVTWPLISAGAVMLFGLWLGLSGRRGTAMMTAARVTGGVAVAVWALVAATFAMTAAPGLTGWGRGDAWMRSLGNGGGVKAPAEGVQGIAVGGSFDVTAMLKAGDTTPKIHVSGSYTGPFVVDTMTLFDGHTWTPQPSGQGIAVGAGDYLTRPGQDQPDWRTRFPTTASTEVRYIDWQDPAIPVPTAPSRIREWRSPAQVVTGWSGVYDTRADTLRAPGPPDAGDIISFDADLLDRSQLAQLPAMSPEPGHDDELAAGPQTSHSDDLRMLVAIVTGQATSAYDKLMAIQNYLRSPAFTYTLTPTPGTSDDAVWDFLQRKAGYCVQFTTAMVVMGRLAGIPMRAAVGFTAPPGGTGDISDGSAHMWPQAHFQDVGWVDFEPTPGGTSNAVPTSSSPAATPTTPTSSGPSMTPASTTEETRLSPGRTSSTTTGSVDAPRGNFPWAVVLAVLGAVAAVGLALVGRLAYIRRWTPERAWASITRTARKRRLLTRGATPRATVTALRPLLDDDAQRQLAELAGEVERLRFSPDALVAPPDRHWHDVQTSVLHAMRHGRRGA